MAAASSRPRYGRSSAPTRSSASSPAASAGPKPRSPAKPPWSTATRPSSCAWTARSTASWRCASRTPASPASTTSAIRKSSPASDPKPRSPSGDLQGYDGSGEAGAFGGEDDAVAGDAFADTGKDQLRTAQVQSVHKGPDQVLVATRMAFGGGRAVDRGVDRDCALGAEVVDLDVPAVPGQLAPGAEDLGVAVLQRGERGHGERRRRTARILEVHHLMVGDVVVAGINAPAVRPVRQRVRDRLFGEFPSGDDPGEVLFGTAVAQAVAIDLGRRVRAGVLQRAVEAAVGGPGRAALRAAVVQAAERRRAHDRLTDEIAEPVDVVTGLGQQRERRLVGTPPVAAHEGMGE